MNGSSFQTFQNPPAEFGIIPLWFWNDDLREDELLRQLREFHRAGFGGVIPHPRIGLSKRIGYLTDEYFRLVRLVVGECARLGMKVILYDEGCYPSGSARGEVVRENPEYASRCIGLLQREVKGPFHGFWRPNTGRALLDQHVCTVLGRVDTKGRVDPKSLRLLDPQPHDMLCLDVPKGRWLAMSVWHTHSGGHVRGVFAEEETRHATAPPSGDVLNPDAVACFLRLTHDRYYKHLKKHFGKTIIGMFTDEPSPMGKGPHRFRPAHPFTPGFAEWLQKHWGHDPRPWLPSLWVDYGKGTTEFRARYKRAVHDRLHEVFYAMQSKWCRDHGIALTGHPSGGNEMSALHVFQIPGQDVVWRSVLPNSPSALKGAQSVTAKAATSGARLHGRRRTLTEVCGAYGWQHTLDELKWLFDWHLVRGNNLINAHAVFYSIRDRRAWESEPDLGVHNVWWPHFHHVANYTRRMCWLLSDGEHVCDVAILGDGNNLPWEAAKVLYQNQIDFLYVDDQAVANGSVANGRIQIGTQSYRAIIIDGDPVLGANTRNKLQRFADKGGTLLRFEDKRSLVAQFSAAIPRDIQITPANRDLRFIHYRKNGVDFYFLVNEGEAPIRGKLRLNATGSVECWNALSGERVPIPARKSSNGVVVSLDLDRRASAIIVIDPNASFVDPTALPKTTEKTVPIQAKWKVKTLKGKSLDLRVPGDWAQQKGFELFTGTLVYTTTIKVPQADELWLDLGRVGEIAELFFDGKSKGVCLWSPHRFFLGHNVRPGRYQIEVRVTNCMANEFDGLQLPSGLIGPVSLVVKTRSR